MFEILWRNKTTYFYRSTDRFKNITAQKQKHMITALSSNVNDFCRQALLQNFFWWEKLYLKPLDHSYDGCSELRYLLLILQSLVLCTYVLFMHNIILIQRYHNFRFFGFPLVLLQVVRFAWIAFEKFNGAAQCDCNHSMKSLSLRQQESIHKKCDFSWLHHRSNCSRVNIRNIKWEVVKL